MKDQEILTVTHPLGLTATVILKLPGTEHEAHFIAQRDPLDLDPVFVSLAQAEIIALALGELKKLKPDAA